MENNEIIIPQGDSSEDKKRRREVIANFYRVWKLKHPQHYLYNVNLRENISIKYISVTETIAHASKKYLSTLAVLQLDAILTGARPIRIVPAKATDKNQKAFRNMLLMEYELPGIGTVKLVVGIHKRTKEKIQYCITAIEV